MPNSKIIEQLYAEFGRGDVPAILARLADDVEWEYGATSTDVPWYQLRHGKAGALEFFQSLADFEFHQFQPKAILDGPGGMVVSVIDIDLTLRRNNARITFPDEVHIFHFNAEGKVTRFCHRVDTHLFWRAMQQ